MRTTADHGTGGMGRVAKSLGRAGIVAFALSAICASSATAVESLPVCAKCLNPRVISKTGAGTASAAVEAKVTAEDAAAWCAVNMPRYKNCVIDEVAQGGDGARTSYRATANCSSGQLHSMNGGDYTYAGIWNEGAGRGQPNFRDPGGNIPQWESIHSGTGKARGEWDLFGGLSLAGQWKVLCGGAPAPVSAAPSRPAVSAAGSKPVPASADAEWLSLCGKCDNPTVFAKSGTGTANSVAEARLKETGNKIYRAKADCTAGRITTIEEQSFALAGVWDNSDIGAGRTKWRGADGQIVGRDNASNGLAISQQWEVLCPGAVSPGLLSRAAVPEIPVRPASARASEAAKPQGRAGSPPVAEAASACAGKRFCDEVPAFAAIVRDFRPSLGGDSTRVVSATVRFLNKTARPLTLGYVRNAGVAIDEQGNRYVLASPENVRGIAEITGGRDFDPKFTIAPGQTGDARFEFVWRWNGRDIIGQRAWDVDLTVREVNEVAPGQYRFGQEHAMQFRSLAGANTTSAGQVSAGAQSPLSLTGGSPPSTLSPAPAPVAQVPAPEPDACGGKTRCYDAGPFVAEIAQATLSREGNFQDRVVRLNVRFRNKTNEPISLAYVVGTSVLIDNLGRRFTWGSGHDVSATGIGKVESNKADPQFMLRPGESRAATFTLFRRRPPQSDPDGTGYTYEVTIAQLEVLYNGQQVRTTREHTMTFPDFGLNGPLGGGIALPGGVKAAPQSIKELGDALKGTFGTKKK
jgi:hypothetical protein